MTEMALCVEIAVSVGAMLIDAGKRGLLPNKPRGTVSGHKTTSAQQKIMGIARGMQKGDVPKSYSKEAAKIAKDIPASDLHNIAKKPKAGYRRAK